MIKNIVTILILALFFKNAKSQCNRAADSLALVEFYLNTDGPNWTDNTNWLKEGKPIDTWKGVLVNSNGCVWFLSLGSNNLIGTLDKGLPNLTGLEYLYLFGNKLKGEIPKSFQKLIQLTSLTLSRNKLTGQIPAEIRYLTQLENLSLYDNLLSGPLPNDLYVLFSLKSLNLARNNFTGNLSNIIVSLANLEYLDLGYNKFVGTIPANLGTLSKLKSLDLSDNSFIGIIPPSIKSLINLEELWLSSNGLNGDINQVLGDFTNLKVLNVSDNDFSGEINIDFGKYQKLEQLNLSRNNFTGVLPGKINSLKNIIRPIDFSENKFMTPIPDDLIQSKGIFIDNNNFTFKDFFKFISLNPGSSSGEYNRQNQFYFDTIFYAKVGEDYVIDLDIDPLIADNIYKWSKNGNQNWVPNMANDANSNKLLFPSISLSDVATYDARVTNPNFSPIVRLQSNNIGLRVCNRFNDSLELVKLYESTLGDTWTNHSNWLEISLPIQTWYGIKVDSKGCINKIDLTNNNLTGELPILDLNTLDTLILSSNNLTGIIPNLKVPFIKYLDLSGNMFSGNIPTDLTSWMKLHTLNLSNNILSGIVPPDIGDLCDLEELRLNNNNFGDELPVELTYLQNLKIGSVDFSNNNIDSLKQKIAFFCPFGDNILNSNPSYDRFLGICNVTCSGFEYDSISTYNWIMDSLISLEIKYCNSELCKVDVGYTLIRNVKVFYSRLICFNNLSSNGYIETTTFFDCGGNVLEVVSADTDGDFNSSGTVLKDEYDNISFEIKWSCGNNSRNPTSVKDVDFQNSKNVKGIKCYPNPSFGEIKFLLEEDMDIYSVQVYDINGRNVRFSFEIEKNENKVIMNSSYKGIFIIKITGKNNLFIGRFIIVD